MRITPSYQALPLWRSILFVPAVSDRFVESALKQAADVLQISRTVLAPIKRLLRVSAWQPLRTDLLKLVDKCLSA